MGGSGDNQTNGIMRKSHLKVADKVDEGAMSQGMWAAF